MLVLLNFQAEAAVIEIDFSKLDFQNGREIWDGDLIDLRGTGRSLSGSRRLMAI